MSTNTHMMKQHIYMHTHNYCVFANTQTQEFGDTDGALWPFSLISWSIFGSVKRSPLHGVQSTRQTSMVNLEKLLLAVSAVLDTPTSEENVQWYPPRQRKRKVSFAYDAKGNDHMESSRRLSTSQLPPKKNLAILRKDDDSNSREGGTVDSGNEIIGRDQHKDEDDQKRAMMVETRATEKTENNLTKILRKRTGKQREGSSLEVHALSSRSKAEREAALADLKRRADAASAARGCGCQCSSTEKIILPANKVNGSNLMTLSNVEESSRNEMELSSGEDIKPPELPILHEIMGHMPIRQGLLLKKRQALEKVNSSTVYSAAIVKQRVEEKRPAVWKPAMIAVEKFHLTRELELANDDDIVELKRIKGRVQELEAARASRRRSRKKALVELAVQSMRQISMVNLEKLPLVSTKENVQQ